MYIAINRYTDNGSELCDAAACLEFNPSGSCLAATSCTSNSICFSSSINHPDQETGVYYYGYRYLTPELGRFVNRDPIGERGSVLLYGFVRNNGIDRFDFLGLFLSFPDPTPTPQPYLPTVPTLGNPLPPFVSLPIQGNPAPPSSTRFRLKIQCDTCGPDISDNLRKVLANLNNDFAGWGLIKKNLMCSALLFPPFAAGAWDIDQLYLNTVYMHGCPEGDACKNTVTIDGQCHYMSRVNYVLFGAMGKLCERPEWELRGMVEAWKRTYHPISGPDDPTIDWFHAGYLEWPKAPTPLSDKRLKDCVACDKKFPHKLTYTWDLNRWRKRYTPGVDEGYR